MAGNEITVKIKGLEEFKKQCNELKEHVDMVNKAIKSLPWYVRIVLAAKGFSFKDMLDIETKDGE